MADVNATADDGLKIGLTESAEVIALKMPRRVTQVTGTTESQMGSPETRITQVTGMIESQVTGPTTMITQVLAMIESRVPYPSKTSGGFFLG